MNPERFHGGTWWALSLAASIASIAYIGFMWSSVEPGYKEGVTEVSSPDDLDALFRDCRTKEFKGGRQPIRIPLGVFIQSFAFLNANDVNLNGYIWMKFPKELPDGFVKDFIFPEEVDSNTTETERIYTIDQQDHTLIGWYFDVIVRQSFDYSMYPLDYHSVWLRIWSKDFANDQQIIIVPDFDSYRPASLAANLFGLDDDIVPSGWHILETFFSYRTIDYDTSFGFEYSDTDQSYTEMYFNLGIYRSFVDAFVINLVPLFFVLVLLFALVMTVSGDETRKQFLGFTTLDTVAICASLLFVVVMLHVQFRSRFAGSDLVYIEFFYMIVYLVIFLAALNSYVFTSRQFGESGFFFYRDNFVPKVLYWPSVLGLMALATWYNL